MKWTESAVGCWWFSGGYAITTVVAIVSVPLETVVIRGKKRELVRRSYADISPNDPASGYSLTLNREEIGGLYQTLTAAKGAAMEHSVKLAAHGRLPE